MFTASDKCNSESECLSFDQHMIIASEMWEKHLNYSSNGTWMQYNHDKYNSLNRLQEHQPTVVFTTEATRMVEEHKVFVEENQTVSKYPYFQFQFMTNHHDVTPDSGFMRFISSKCNTTLSSLEYTNQFFFPPFSHPITVAL
jgi:nitrogenase molybdenum-iron protein alpha/beta subunit